MKTQSTPSPSSLANKNNTIHQSRSPRSAPVKPPQSTKEASPQPVSTLTSIRQEHCNSTCHNVFYLCISDITGKPPCDMVQLDSRRIDSDHIEFSGDERDTRMAYPFNYTFYRWSVSEIGWLLLDIGKIYSLILPKCIKEKQPILKTPAKIKLLDKSISHWGIGSTSW